MKNNSVIKGGVDYYNCLYLANKRNIAWGALKRIRNSEMKGRVKKMRLLQEFLIAWINSE